MLAAVGADPLATARIDRIFHPTHTGAPAAGAPATGAEPQVDERPLATGRFTIPFRISPEKRASVREALLYLSKDRGKTWQLHSRLPANHEGFLFQATQDGPHWFSVGLLDLNGRHEPANIYTAPVGQKILVDTTKPEARLAVHRIQSEISLQWEIREDHLNLNSLRLECRTVEMPPNQWIPIQVQPGITGSGSFPAPSAGPVTVRLHASDVAGNFVSIMGEAPAAPAAPVLNAPTFAAGPGAPALGVSNPGALGSVPGLAPTTYNNPYPGGAYASVPTPNGSLQVGSSAYNPAPGNFNPAQGNIEATTWTPPGGVPQPQHVPTVSTQGPAPVGGNPIAGSPMGGNIQGTPISQPISQVSTATPLAKPARMVNQRLVQVDYELGRVGPSGVGAVEVWTTLDEGETWTLATTETMAQSGMELTANPAVPTRNKIPLNIQREGVPQGFTLVAKSRAGLGRPAPQRGEAPQIRLECDTTAPEATLFSPVPDPDQRDHLLLSWKASDKNLVGNPITIEWSDGAAGPWHKIGPGELPNSGRLSWLVPPGTPPTVHLRLTVKDQAGNKGVAQTQQPILVDLAIPEVNILGLSTGK